MENIEYYNQTMSSIADTMLKEIMEGRPYAVLYDMKDIRVQQEFMQILQRSPLKEIHQLEALGGTLYNMRNDVRMEHNSFSEEDLRFLVSLCTEYVHIDYLVVCILDFIMTTLTYSMIDQGSILPEIYSFFAFLIKYNHTKQSFEINWSSDVVLALLQLCDFQDDICTLFLEDHDLIPIFAELLKTNARGNLGPWQFISSNEIRIRASLIGIPGFPPDFICFDFAYHFLSNQIKFQNMLAEYWPFILDENKRLHDRKYIKDILHDIIKEESYPKSANKY
jgi:hypothetical protein